jgi:lipoprotein-anchoring transpeptidase ErfK/SrfK
VGSGLLRTLAVIGACLALVFGGVTLVRALTRDGAPARPAPAGSVAPHTAHAPAAPAPPPILASGAEGPEVEAVQRRLAELGYDPGAIDGKFADGTQAAVFALEKVHGLPVNGEVGDAERKALAAPVTPPPLRAGGAPDHVEVDLTRQLLFVYQGGNLVLISHTSTGNGEHFCANGGCMNAVTPAGDFTFLWEVKGNDPSAFGPLYNPVYFHQQGPFAFAVHGYNHVPTHPASHGCVRVPMHVADKFQGLVRIGEPIHVVQT